MSTFREQLKQFFAKTFKGFYIEVTKPKKFLLDCGVPDLPIVITPANLTKKIEKHNLTKDDLQSLNTLLNSPLIVYHSQNQGKYYSAFSVITERKNNEGYLCVVIYINKKINKIEINNIASIHYRNINSLIKWCEENYLIDSNIEKCKKVFSGSCHNDSKFEYLLSLLDTAKLKQKNQNTKGLGKNIWGFLGFEGLGKLVNHNTPHLLQREDGSYLDPETGLKLGFDNRHMGSGEGAQVYGWGVYLSVDDLRKYGDLHKRNIRIKEEIFDCNFIQYGQIVSVPLRATRDEVKAYKLALTAGNIASYFDLYDCSKKDVENYIKSLIDEINTKIKNKEKEFSQTQSFLIKREIDSNKQRLDDYKYLLSHVKVKAVRHHYDVEIPDYDGKNYLPYQKPINSKQRDMICAVLDTKYTKKITSNITGEQIYDLFTK
ncbi:MAG: hypothetical protein II939_08510, partial [Bacteroidales bacterium]|nr:hypothetical protein [Bacteroidales bacterium]